MNLPANSNLERVYNLLPHGMDHPITAKELEKITGISMRDVYSIINTLIMKYDIPVAGVRSGRQGYFIVTNENERQLVLKPLMSHTAKMEQHIKKLSNIPL